jgi:hypothetical protein
MISFRLYRLKRLKVFSLWYSASRARSRSSTNLAYCKDLSLSLAFSGSVGFGTWRIFVLSLLVVLQTFDYLGYLHTLLYYPYYFWILELLYLWFLYTLFAIVLLGHQGGVFFKCNFSILCLPFVFLR